MSALSVTPVISHLPPEERVNVLSYLHPKEQLTMRKVSHIWNTLSQDRSGLFALVQSMAGMRSEGIKKMHGSVPRNFNAFLDRIVNTAFNQSLDSDNKIMSGFLNKILQYKSKTNSEEMMQWLRALPPQKKAAIQDLHITSPITDRQLAEVFKTCPSLKELHFVGEDMAGKGFEHIPQNNQLESITLPANLEESFFSTVLSRATKLKTIIVHSSITDEQLAEIFVKCPNLKNLNLLGSNITGKGLSNIPKNNQLESISLHSDNLEEGFLSMFFSKAIKLKSICLTISNITGEALCHIPVNNQLEEVCLGLNGNLEENYLIEFFSKATMLKKIDLSNTLTTGQALTYVVSKQLESVVLNLCPNLKENHLIQFFSQATTLKEVCLDVVSMTGEALANIPLNNQLKFISINGCKNLEEAFLWEFLAKANKATTIRCQGLSNPLRKILRMFQILIQGVDFKLSLTPKEIINFLHHLPATKREEVQSLDFTAGPGVFTSVTEEEIAILLQLCPNVKFLNVFLKTCEGLSHISENNKLEKLALATIRPDEEALAQFFSKAKNLKEFDFRYSRTTGEGLSNLPENNQLERIRLNNCKRLNEKALAKLFAKGAKLNEVDLSYSNTSCEGLSYLPEENQLVKLNLCGCRFDQEFFTIVSKKATKLKNVKFKLG